MSKGEEEPHVDDLHVDGDAVVNGNAEVGLRRNSYVVIRQPTNHDWTLTCTCLSIN